ncbi:MAG: glycosyltransferase family 2 protein [Bacteroidales bacterium]|nr:glycosyltransferase family 2 protein [Bacteroidales bacterium]
MEKLSLVISVYNEEDNVAPLFDQIKNALSDIRYEAIFVDDGSTDATVSKLKAINDERVHVVELKKNYGQSSALLAGFDHATGDYIVTMDGDMQNDPSDIPMMLQKLKEGDYDLVTGIRADRKDDFFIRKIPSIIANRIISKASNIKIKDNGCALKVFKADLAKSLGLYGELHRLISVLAALEGARIGQVNVKHHPRIHGKSKYGLSRILKVISDLTLLMFFKKYIQKPMHFFGSWGMVIFGAGILINLYMFVLKMLGNDIWGKPMLLLGILLVIAGFQLITIGIITELLIRTYYESQKKRPFAIRNIFVGGKKL